jgi:chemotaxis protein CheZ
MPKQSIDVARLLEELRAKYGDTVQVEEVAKVVGALMSSGTGDMRGLSRKIYAELEALNTYIQTAKTEIAALRPDEVKDEFLPAAATELDAIVDATAEATNTIMDATEAIETVAEGLDQKLQDTVLDATTKIYEACGFQDITGQRINKVVNTLNEIEVKVDALVKAFGSEIDDIKEKAKAKVAETAEVADVPSDEDLLQGPQKTGEGISQDEIDRLLADFD